MNPGHYIICHVLGLISWLKYGWKNTSPVRPNRILWVNPNDIDRKPVQKPSKDRVPPTLVVGGDWDHSLEKIENDIVFKAFKKRFVERKSWEETGYVEFLSTDISEHGDCSTTSALERCEIIDDLYDYIDEHGYKSQKELNRKGDLLDGITDSIRPPIYREIAVNITRNGEIIWHAGMHRLVITQLLDIDQIPVRVNIRHKQWQEIREAAYTNGDYEEFHNHPDIEYLM